MMMMMMMGCLKDISSFVYKVLCVSMHVHAVIHSNKYVFLFSSFSYCNRQCMDYMELEMSWSKIVKTYMNLLRYRFSRCTVTGP